LGWRGGVGPPWAAPGGDQGRGTAPAPQREALEGPRRRRAPPEVGETHEQARVRRDDPEVLLVEVEVPALHRARLQDAPVPLDGTESRQSLDTPILPEPGRLREEAVRTAEDGHLAED